MKFENILEEINGFGRFQVLLVLLICLPRIILPCHFLLNIFIAAVPPHHCDVSSLDQGECFRNLSQEQRLRTSIPVTGDGNLKNCEMFAEPQFHLLANISEDGAVEKPSTVSCQDGWIYDNSTFSSTITSEWDLVCDKKSLTKTSSTIFFLGVMLGSVVFGYLCDKYGRRRTLLASYLLTILLGLSSAFANSFVVFAVLRFLTGFGITGISLISLVLTMEWVDTEHRSFVGVIGSLSWAVGNMMLAGLAFLVRDWRTLLIVVTAPLSLAVLTWWWIPESARWLLVNGRVELAQVYLDRCAKVNKRHQWSTKVKLEALSDEEHQDKNYTYLDLVKTPRIRKISLITGIVWFGVASTYYGISLNIGGFGVNIFLTHFIYAAIEVPAKLTVYCFLDFIGRRRCLSGSLLLTATCIAVNLVLPKDLFLVRTIVAILGKGLSEAAFTTVMVFTSELYPTVIRQNGLGYANFMSRLGVSMAPLILLLEDVWILLPQIILCSMAITAGLASLQFPETRGIRLPETIEDVEKPRKKATATVSPKATEPSEVDADI